MKTLYLMRHAKSSWGDSSLADHERPLNYGDGRMLRVIGEFLTSEGRIPDLIVCSTAMRARQTVEYLLKSLSFDGEVKFLGDLYHGGTEEFIGVLIEVPDIYNAVMLVGHNPGMEMAVEDLTGEWVRMSTAAVAEIGLEIDNWAELDEALEGELLTTVKPRELK